MKKAIITFGVGYKFEHIFNFITTCNEHVPDADIFLFAGKNLDELKKSCSQFPRVHLIPFREGFWPKVISKLFTAVPGLGKWYANLLQGIFLKTGNSTPLQALTVPLLQFMVKRFFIIDKWIKKIPHERIMLSDIRDVLLQGDPFAEVQHMSIISGDEPITIAQSEMNSRWIKQTFCEERWESLKNQKVVCAGVTIGSRRAIEQYVAEMIEETYYHLDKIINMLGADQAIHMHLFYNRLKGLDKKIESNGSGSIATLHFSTLEEFTVQRGSIENRTGKKLAVVHQYDRHPILLELLSKLPELAG